MSGTLSDEEVVQRVRSGDRESYGLLAARHQQRLQGLARRLLQNDFDAEDAVQGAHLLALRHFDQYQGRAGYVQWMTSITLNEARSRFRRNKVTAASEELKDCQPAPGPDPEQLALSGDIRRLVHTALDKLPPDYSLVLRLRALADLSTAETCQRLGLTAACVKTRLHRARLMFRRALEADRPGVRATFT